MDDELVGGLAALALILGLWVTFVVVLARTLRPDDPE